VILCHTGSLFFNISIFSIVDKNNNARLCISQSNSHTFQTISKQSLKRYSEGYPGARYYGGNENIDKVKYIHIYLCKLSFFNVFLYFFSVFFFFFSPPNKITHNNNNNNNNVKQYRLNLCAKSALWRPSTWTLRSGA
jgi:hypothetical protein